MKTRLDCIFENIQNANFDKIDITDIQLIDWFLAIFIMGWRQIDISEIMSINKSILNNVKLTNDQINFLKDIPENDKLCSFINNLKERQKKSIPNNIYFSPFKGSLIYTADFSYNGTYFDFWSPCTNSQHMFDLLYKLKKKKISHFLISDSYFSLHLCNDKLYKKPLYKIEYSILPCLEVCCAIFLYIYKSEKEKKPWNFFGEYINKILKNQNKNKNLQNKDKNLQSKNLKNLKDKNFKDKNTKNNCNKKNDEISFTEKEINEIYNLDDFISLFQNTLTTNIKTKKRT